MPAQSTIDKALDALNGMDTIVKREMTGRVGYVSQDVYDEKLQKRGALCQGRKYCAIGSLWVGYGVKPILNDFNEIVLPGADEGDEREDFLRGRPGLRLAYDALNEATVAFVEKTGRKFRKHFEAPVEDLFERGEGLDRETLHQIVLDAKRRVRKAVRS